MGAEQLLGNAAYFAQVGLKKDPKSGDKKVGGTAVEGAKPLYEIVYDKTSGEVTHDRTGAITLPKFPLRPTTKHPRRQPGANTWRAGSRRRITRISRKATSTACGRI